MASSPEFLYRRELLRLGVGAAALGAPWLLGGCRSGQGAAVLALTAKQLPVAWLKGLPDGWRARQLEAPQAVLEQGRRDPVAALLALSDGWAGSVASSSWQPFGAPELLASLTPLAASASRLFAPEGQPALAYPWSFTPWVILLRSRPDLQERAEQGWSLLLDPSLRGRLVLPSSPRVCMALVGSEPEQLKQLRRQALAYDERDGLNLVLSGEAEAAVLPLRRLVPLLRRDLRLAVLWPASGAPLSWQLLLRPTGVEQPVPLAWLADLLEGPLLASLLAAGWVPPLPRQQLEPLVSRFPAATASLLLPPPGLLERCWSLPPLDTAARLALQSRWDAAAPLPGA